MHQYKFVNTGNYQHFAFCKDTQQEPYNYELYIRFPEKLLYCMTKVLSPNSQFLEDIKVRSVKSFSAYETIINKILSELMMFLKEEQFTDRIDLWDYFKLFLYPEDAPKCDIESQKNVIIKFMMILLMQLVFDYDYYDYVVYGSSIRKNQLVCTFDIFYDDTLKMGNDKSMVMKMRQIMKQQLNVFSDLYTQYGFRGKGTYHQKEKLN